MAEYVVNDFVAINSRLKELFAVKEPRRNGTSTAHCDHCPKEPDEPCAISCSAEAVRVGVI